MKHYYLLFITPTSSICEPQDLLSINISLVPDQPVDQSRPSRIPPLVQPSFHGCTDVHLGQTPQWGDGRQWGRRCKEDP